MNALIKKEIRLLLPAWIAALLLAIFPIWLQSIWFQKPDDFQFFQYCFVLGAVFLGLASFGHEFSFKTFTLSLSQPMPRQRLWRIKACTLAAAFASDLLALFLSLLVYSGWHHLGKWSFTFLDSPNSFGWLAVVAFCILAGGPWTTLLLRQVTASFWFMILIPLFIMVLVVGLGDNFNFEVSPKMLSCILLPYAVASMWFARWLFLRAQDVAWSGGNIVWPQWRAAARVRLGTEARRFWRPHAALFWKEVQLHQSLFVMTGVLLLLHLGVLAVRTFGHFQKGSATEFVLETFWGLWLVMPMITGAAAVAEERNLGTLASQLCLPVRPRTQFATKLQVVLLLSLLFGAILPLLLEGRRILPDFHILPSGYPFYVNGIPQLGAPRGFFWHFLLSVNFLSPLLCLVAIATGIGIISFYASSLTRNTLQALAPAVLVLIIFAFLMVGAQHPDFLLGVPAWNGSLIYFVGIPAFVVVLVRLSFGNYQLISPVVGTWLQNGLALLATLFCVVAATTIIYNRAWEELTLVEPTHQVPQLSLTKPTILTKNWNTVSVRLANGRIWAENYSLNIGPAYPLAQLSGNIGLIGSGDGHFYSSSNWMNPVRSPRMEEAGLKTDGTLWVSEKAGSAQLSNGVWQTTSPGGLVRFGSDTNWTSIGSWVNGCILLTKSDGTLWRLGENNWKGKHKWPGLRSFTPQRLGTESNWFEVSLKDYGLYLRKTDGSVWTTPYESGIGQQTIVLEPTLVIQRSPYLEQGTLLSASKTVLVSHACRVGIDYDGTFCIMAEQRVEKDGRLGAYYSERMKRTNRKLGQDTNWLDVAGSGTKVVTLKNDGTLWLWPFFHYDWMGWDPDRDESVMLKTEPVRLGIHSDWVAITSAEGGIISLAADGSLWFWKLESAEHFFNQYGETTYWDGVEIPNFEPLMALSRKPQLIGNIFKKSQ